MSEYAVQGIVCAMVSGGVGFMLAIIVHVLTCSFDRSLR